MAVLFIAAGLVVTRVAILINRTFNSATANIITKVPVDYRDSDDFDNDGLSNADEAFWGTDSYNADTDGDGYLDGEEILSDHDPLLADNDSLAAQREFLSLSSTERMAQLALGGILAGDLKKGSANYAQTINDLVDNSMYSVLSALEDVEIDENIENIADDSKESQENYLKVLFPSISEKLTDLIIKQPKEMVMLFSPNTNGIEEDWNTSIYTDQQQERIKSTYLQYAVDFQRAFEKMQEVAVPRNWIDVHKKVLTLLKKLEMYHRSIALSTDDPMKEMMVLGNLQNVFLEARPLTIQIAQRIKNNNLTPPESDFFDVSMILANQ